MELKHNTHLSHLSGIQVQDSDCMVVSVSNKQCRPFRTHTQTPWLRELSMLKGSINETSVTCPCQGSADFCYRVDHFNLGGVEGEEEEEEEEEGGEEEEEEEEGKGREGGGGRKGRGRGGTEEERVREREDKL